MIFDLAPVYLGYYIYYFGFVVLSLYSPFIYFNGNYLIQTMIKCDDELCSYYLCRDILKHFYM